MLNRNREEGLDVLLLRGESGLREARKIVRIRTRRREMSCILRGDAQWLRFKDKAFLPADNKES